MRATAVGLTTNRRSKVAWLILMSVAVATATGAMAQQSEVHTFHCLNGCPVGAPATNDLVVREIYTLSSNDLTKLADWVAYRVTRESIGQSRDRDWRGSKARARPTKSPSARNRSAAPSDPPF